MLGVVFLGYRCSFQDRVQVRSRLIWFGGAILRVNRATVRVKWWTTHHTSLRRFRIYSVLESLCDSLGCSCADKSIECDGALLDSRE